MILDAHIHFWRIGANDCTWPTPDLTAIHRDFLPADFTAASRACGVEGAVLVQSQESDRDTDWLLTLAARTETVRAVVGWTNLAAPNAAARIGELARRPKLRGLRPMLQGMADDAWILREDLSDAIAAMIECGLCFDALVYTRHLPHLARFAARHRHLPIVIDHAAKPPIAAGELEPWRDRMSQIAKAPNVCCKLSGLLTEAGPEPNAEFLAPYVAHLVNVFGAERLIWGSDWPVLTLAGGYGQWLGMASALTGLKGAALDSVFAGAARAFYRI